MKSVACLLLPLLPDYQFLDFPPLVLGGYLLLIYMLIFVLAFLRYVARIFLSSDLILGNFPVVD